MKALLADNLLHGLATFAENLLIALAPMAVGTPRFWIWKLLSQFSRTVPT